jgi:hypothetical protein
MIDNKLGDLINSYPSRSKIRAQFLRESRGIYRYGSKKVNVIMEGNKLFLKFGNSVMSFDDFIDKYGDDKN